MTHGLMWMLRSSEESDRPGADREFDRGIPYSRHIQSAGDRNGLIVLLCERLDDRREL